VDGRLGNAVDLFGEALNYRSSGVNNGRNRQRSVAVADQLFGFYAAAFVLTMNKAKYESLPVDLKKVVDDNSGLSWAIRAGKGFDQGDVAGLEATEGTGEIHKIEGPALAEFQAAADRATAAYLKELDDQGLPGTETYNKVKGYVTECKAEVKG
jgi:hypothetical protein